MMKRSTVRKRVKLLLAHNNSVSNMDSRRKELLELKIRTRNHYEGPLKKQEPTEGKTSHANPAIAMISDQFEADEAINIQASEDNSQDDNRSQEMIGVMPLSSPKMRRILRAQQIPAYAQPYYMEQFQPGVEFVPWGNYGPPEREMRQSPRTSSRHSSRHSSITLSQHSSITLSQHSSRTIDEEEPIQVNNSDAEVSVITDIVTDDVIDGTIGDRESPMPPRKQYIRNPRVLFAGLLLVVLTVGAVVVGITVFNRKSTNQAVQGVTTPMDPPTVSCNNLFNRKQPSVITQCSCFGKITIVADDVAANYERLLSGGFVETARLGFNGTINSCDPSNQALVWLASATGSSSPNANLQQRFIIALLYITWNGRFWTVNNGWLSSDNECVWTGVTCDRFGVVTEVDLYNNQVTGNLGTAFSLLTSLEALTLGYNDIEGSLPSELGNLASLTSLSLEINQVTGSLPLELGQLTLLVELSLSQNRISGTIPTWLGQLTNLQTLSLSNNTFTPMPAATGNTSVSSVPSPRNAFPTEFGLLTNLQTFQIARNGLHGTLPTEIFNLKSPLLYLDVSYNALSGTIPNLVGDLGQIGKFFVFILVKTEWNKVSLLSLTYMLLYDSVDFAFNDNNFTGTIPPEFVQCTELANLILSDNQLHGQVPSSLGLLTLLRKFVAD